MAERDSDDLVVSGGGSLVVASDELLARMDRLRALAERLTGSSTDILAVADAARVVAAREPSTAAALARAIETMESAASTSRASGGRATAIGIAVKEALISYGMADRIAQQASSLASAAAAWWFGKFASVFVVPAVAGTVLGNALARVLTGQSTEERRAGLERFLLDHQGILTNPIVVDLVRDTAEGLDEFGEGLLGLPPELSALFAQSQGTGALPLTAGFVLLLGRTAGFWSETGISLRQTSTSSGALPPRSIVDRIDRIPDIGSEPHGEQVRIDRYSSPGKPDRFDVYIAGTADFDTRTGRQPFDMTSNLAGVAQQSPASYREVVQAMHAAGITSTTPVQVTGYSQGGLIAALVAGSGRFDVKGLLTFGAPSGEVPISPDVPVLAVRHTDDLVPATGGYDINTAPVIVERRVFDDRAIPTGLAVPAHSRGYYRETAGLIDAARSHELRAAADGFDDFATGTDTVTTTLWVADRTKE